MQIDSYNPERPSVPGRAWWMAIGLFGLALVLAQTMTSGRHDRRTRPETWPFSFVVPEPFNPAGRWSLPLEAMLAYEAPAGRKDGLVLFVGWQPVDSQDRLDDLPLRVWLVGRVLAGHDAGEVNPPVFDATLAGVGGLEIGELARHDVVVRSSAFRGIQIVVMAIAPGAQVDEESLVTFESLCRSIQVNRRALPR